MQFKVLAGQMHCGILHVIGGAAWRDKWGRIQVEKARHIFCAVNGNQFHNDVCKRKLNNYAQLNLQRIGNDLNWR